MSIWHTKKMILKFSKWLMLFTLLWSTHTFTILERDWSQGPTNARKVLSATPSFEVFNSPWKLFLFSCLFVCLFCLFFFALFWKHLYHTPLVLALGSRVQSQPALSGIYVERASPCLKLKQPLPHLHPHSPQKQKKVQEQILKGLFKLEKLVRQS